MSLPTPTQFLDAVRDARLLDDAALNELQSLPDDIDAIVRHVRERNLLSPYQTDELIAGRGNGLKIGPYSIFEKIHEQTGYADFKVMHPAFPKPLSIRLVRSAWLEPADQPAEYVSRVQAACLVSSTHLTNILDAGTHEDQCYVVQEWADGCGLDQLVAEMGVIPVSLAAEYVRQAATAIKAAHDQGVVHGSISPHTMILTPVKRVVQEATGFVTVRPRAGSLIKLTNLGMTPARPPLQDVTFGNTETIGEIAFLPPERFSEPGPNAAGDLYGLGAGLYFLLTGRAPYQGSSAIDVMLQLQQGEFTPLESLRNDIPVEILDLLRRTLSRDTLQRPSAAEMIHLLLPFCERTAMPPETASSPVPVASETFTRPPIAVDEFEDREDAPLVEPLSDSQPQLELGGGNEDQFGQDDSPARFRPKINQQKSYKWVFVGLLLHGSGVLLLAGWMTNWFAFLRPVPEKQEDQKIEKKADAKSPAKKKKSPPPQKPQEPPPGEQ